MASSGMLFMAQYPHRESNATARKTMNLFLALYSIIFAIIL